MGARFIKYCPASKQWYIMDRQKCCIKIRHAMSGIIRREKSKALRCVMKKISQDPGVNQQTKKLGY